MAADPPGAEPVAGAMPARISARDLCERYASTVCRFAALAAGNDLDADDLAQDALLKAIRHLDRFDPARGTMDAWLWRIVANAARDSFRSRARRIRAWGRLVAGWAEPTESVEDRALGSISHDHLIRAIRALDERDRLLIAMRFGADLELVTVGAAVGLSPDSAGTAVLRALSRLRRRLEVSL